MKDCAMSAAFSCQFPMITLEPTTCSKNPAAFPIKLMEDHN